MCCTQTVHFKPKEGSSQAQHEYIMDSMENVLETDPEQLLPEHQQILDYNLEELAKGSAAEQ